jgi:hypothetical protein
MNMMKETVAMFTRITSRMPRHLYFSLKRFTMFSSSLLVGVAAGLLIIKLLDWSATAFGTPIPGLIAVALAAIGLASYFMAKIDVDLEKRQQERVQQALERDQP